jgi:hypothetical protein
MYRHTVHIFGGNVNMDVSICYANAQVQPVMGCRYRGRDICLSPVFNFLYLYPFKQAATMPLQVNIIHIIRRVAISNSRIVKVEDRRVFFKYRKKGSRRMRTTFLDVMEFMHRFLQHVLPSGFKTVMP